jgi:drug/metabolite transporter (DMT)-like permease
VSNVNADRNALAYALVAIFLLTVMDSIIKNLQPQFSAIQIMYLRSLAGIPFATALFLLFRPGWPSGEQWRSHGLRSLIMLCAGLMFFYALGQMPLAEVFVYTFTAPIFMALFGAVLLKEKLAPSVALGLLLGFIGMLSIVLTDPAARFGSGSLSGLAAAILSPVTYALAMVLLRKQSGQEPLARIVFIQNIFILAAMLPLMALSTPMPQGNDLWKVMVIGVLGTAGTFLLGTAFSRAEAAKVGVSEYTGLIWAALIGYTYFNETPRAMVWIGGLLVIAGCLVVARSRKTAAIAGPETV